MASKNRYPHSIWLCPERHAHGRFKAVIEDIARVSSGPVFAPHVTLLGDLAGDPERTLAACRRHVVPLGPLRATVSGIEQTEAYFMSLFLDLDVPPDLSDRRIELCAALDVPRTSFRPHLSLAYGATSGTMSRAQIAELSARFIGFEFDLSEVCVMRSAQEIPVAEWRASDCVPLVSGT